MKTKTSFKKGEATGRPPGIPNKITRDKKEILAEIADNQIPKINEALSKLYQTDPIKAIELTMKVMEFIMPKMKAMEHSSGDGNVKIKFTYTSDRN